jgi:hypothetical protein
MPCDACLVGDAQLAVNDSDDESDVDSDVLLDANHKSARPRAPTGDGLTKRVAGVGQGQTLKSKRITRVTRKQFDKKIANE